MASINLEVTETERDALALTAYDVTEYLTHYAKTRADIEIKKMQTALVEHCNANGVAMEVGVEKQMQQALTLGVVTRVADIVVPDTLTEEG